MVPKSITLAAAMLLVASLISIAMAAVYENFNVLDDAALFRPSDQVLNPGFGPRYYLGGMPAIPALPPDKAKRQDQTPQPCAAGQHSCLEVGPEGASFCCGNDRYCFINSTWALQCCSLGFPCADDQPCSESLLYCNKTLTSTTTITTSDKTTVLAQTTQASGCCGRPCSSSSFLCQSDFGGQCCPYGANCGSGSSCLFPASSTISTLVTPVPSGCSASQISCATGGGCCNIGSTCTSGVLATSTTQLCAATLAVVDTGGLSEGARVGIGVGVAVGAAIVIGAVTWFWISRRRKANSDRAAEAANRYPGNPDNPGEIVRPIELYTATIRSELGEYGFSVEDNDARVHRKPAMGEHQELYELFGSPGTSPQPLNPEEAEQRRTQGGPFPPPPPSEIGWQQGRK
ncbi:hypothetical protein F4804DRAFT_176387 [Jackrogersella minutella]|nr:hypothetical protein F4804DRAFT_176387 [Jackrogersella minutella]